jgi:plasmid stabilization system protein ParE
VQFLSVAAYINQHNPAAAKRFRMNALTALRRLGRFPRSGSTLPEFPDLPYGEITITPHRFFYRVEGKTIWVVGVWHGAQLPHEPRE